MKVSTKASAAALLAAAAMTLSACGGGDDFGGGEASQNTATSGVTLKMLIASSGDAETNAVKAATAEWAKKTNNTVTVQTATNMDQDLSKAFAGGTPPDIFYLDAARVGDYAKAGNLYAYGDQVSDLGIIDNLNKAFTYDGKVQCAAKDFSTLGLVINNALWKQAGLTDADIPKDWAGLEKVSKTLTTGGVTGLAAGPEIHRLGAFMKQAGGWVTAEDGKTITANSAENVAGLTEAKKLLASGSMKYAKALGAGWGGEAFGKGKAAMVVEGNWIEGAMKKDYPKVDYRVVELPAGPKGKGTLTFSNCWGIAAKSQNQSAAVDLVKSLEGTEQQMKFATAFGVMPSTTEGATQYAAKFPKMAAFAKGAEYGQGPVNLPGMQPVMTDFNTKLEGLAKGDPKAILDSLQKNAEAAAK